MQKEVILLLLLPFLACAPDRDEIRLPTKQEQETIEALFEKRDMKALSALDYAWVDHRLEHGQTLVMQAAQNCDTQMVKALVDAGADLTIGSYGGYKVFQYAMDSHCHDSFFLFMSLSNFTWEDDVAFEWSIAKPAYRQLIIDTFYGNRVSDIPDETQDLGFLTIFGFDYLMYAVLCENLQATALAIERGYSVNAEGGIHCASPLLIAARTGNADIFHLLLQNGANLESEDSDGRSVIEAAKRSGIFSESK